MSGQPALRSVDSERVGRCDRAPDKTTLRRPTSLRQRKAGIVQSFWLGCTAPPGSKNSGMYALGSVREPGRSCRLRRSKPVVGLREKVQANACRCSPCVGAKREHHDGTAERRKRSEAGMDGRESERLVVPLKPGNRPEGPGGGKETPRYGTVGEKDAGDFELRRRLNEDFNG